MQVVKEESPLLELHPQFLKQKGQNQFVVLPYEEFLQVQERLADAEDLLELLQARAENEGQPTIPLEEMLKRFGLGNEESGKP